LVYHFAKVCEQLLQQHGFPKRIYKQIKIINQIITCVVADEVDVPVLGLPSCKVLNVVKLIHSLKKTWNYKVHLLFSKTPVTNLVAKNESELKIIGKLPVEHRIQIKQSAVPVVHPARRLPFKLSDPVLNKLT
jgi:hypothetical protein